MQNLQTFTHQSPTWNLCRFKWKLTHKVLLAHSLPLKQDRQSEEHRQTAGLGVVFKIEREPKILSELSAYVTSPSASQAQLLDRWTHTTMGLTLGRPEP